MKRETIIQYGPLAIAAVGLVVVVSLLYQASQPPIAYDQPVYTPEQAALCPGEELVYTNTLTVDRAALVPFNLAWWSVDKARFVGAPEPLLYRPFPGPARITARRANTVPDLPPGQYELWFVAGETGRSAAGHVVPFSVRGGCK